MYTHEKDFQINITPEQALELLRAGNQRFVNNLKANRNLLQQVNETADGQYPFATILSCMDSRTSAELIFDQGLGDIFSIRIAGNILNYDILGSMEYATNVVGSKLILVLGHTRCGAIAGACDGAKMGHLTGLLDKIKPALDQETTTLNGNRSSSNPDFVRKVTLLNVLNTLEQIRQSSPIIRQLEQENKIKLVAGIYDVTSGEVEILEER